jgi:hypothetical protein
MRLERASDYPTGPIQIVKRRCQVRYVHDANPASLVDPKVPIVCLFALWIDFFESDYRLLEAVH